MRSMSETPLTGKTLAAGDVDVLHDNLGDEVGHLIAKAEKLAAKKAPKPEPKKPTSDVTLSDGRTLHVAEPKKKAEPKLEPVVAQAPMKKTAEPAELDMDTDDSAPKTPRRYARRHRRRQRRRDHGADRRQRHRRDHDRVVGGCGPRARAPHRGGRRRRHAVAQLRPARRSRRTARRPSAWCTSRRAPSQRATSHRSALRSIARSG